MLIFDKKGGSQTSGWLGLPLLPFAWQIFQLERSTTTPQLLVALDRLTKPLRPISAKAALTKAKL